MSVLGLLLALLGRRRLPLVGSIEIEIGLRPLFESPFPLPPPLDPERNPIRDWPTIRTSLSGDSSERFFSLSQRRMSTVLCYRRSIWIGLRPLESRFKESGTGRSLVPGKSFEIRLLSSWRGAFLFGLLGRPRGNYWVLFLILVLKRNLNVQSWTSNRLYSTLSTDSFLGNIGTLFFLSWSYGWYFLIGHSYSERWCSKQPTALAIAGWFAKTVGNFSNSRELCFILKQEVNYFKKYFSTKISLLIHSVKIVETVQIKKNNCSWFSIGRNGEWYQFIGLFFSFKDN